jgi:aminoglycoside phosphotransferase (APT) family kinase protein
MSSAANPDFEPARLRAYLDGAALGGHGHMRLQRIGGGQSNPTYFVDFDDRALVLRKQPNGPVLPSAHAVDREYRILGALAGTGLPVPPVRNYCSDSAVLGTPFYLMDKVAGRVFPDYALSAAPPEQRPAIYRSMAQTLAQLHSLDWQALGLADYGKPGNYFARQVTRWSRQWQLSRAGESPHDIDFIAQWLEQNLPDDEQTAISHGDYRMGNLMFHPTEPRVVAVLDWELSTLGHPLADLAYSVMAWRTEVSEYGGLLGLDLAALGIPDEQRYLGYYYEAMPAGGTRLQPFHYVFALFRIAVIFEGIAARARSGNAASGNAAEVARLGPAFARHARRIIEAGLG